ncbi:hypothetical protein [Jeotgalibaca porci]|uniref:hypothetical protein n=1 Tax=Jeotgalibaca porci TaxID=1868793 RepID=UPI00359F8183
MTNTEKAQNIMRQLKNTKEDFEFYIVESGQELVLVDDRIENTNIILKNERTENIMSIYSYVTDDENEGFYGVYGDFFGGQKDSREAADEEIQDAIQSVYDAGYQLMYTKNRN